MSIDEQWDGAGWVGKTVAGRYRIVSELGADGRRTLYEAEDVEHGTYVSLAVLLQAGPARDGTTLRSLRHPNLAAVLDAGTLDTGEAFFATEIVRGMSLRALVNDGHLEPRRALSIVRQVLHGLAAAHEAGAVHGDVTPERVLISSDAPGVDRARLLDLGVAMLSSADLAGDPRYVAPERASGPLDPRGDLYSVGAVLYELLTDRPPFIADEPRALIRMHAYAPVQTLQQRAPEWRYTPELEQLVARALAKRPDDRFRSADEMIVALDAAAKSVEAVEAAATPARPPPAPADDSIALLAKGLIPVPPRQSVPEIPMNASRHVRPLPWWMRALKVGRRLLQRARELVAAQLERFRTLDRKRQLIVAAVGGALVLGLVSVIAAVMGGDARATAAAKVEHKQVDARDRDVAARARALLDAGDAKQAAALIERELADHPDDAAAYLVLGHARLALGRPGDGLAAYARAIQLVPELANDAELVANGTELATSRDPATAIAALDVLAASTSPPARDAILAQASAGTLATVRHRAVAIAERLDLASSVDRVSSWALDLQQATTCDERRGIITKLAGTRDRRALPALRQARAHTCVHHESSVAIRTIEAGARKH